MKGAWVTRTLNSGEANGRIVSSSQNGLGNNAVFTSHEYFAIPGRTFELRFGSQVHANVLTKIDWGFLSARFPKLVNKVINTNEKEILAALSLGEGVRALSTEQEKQITADLKRVRDSYRDWQAGKEKTLSSKARNRLQVLPTGGGYHQRFALNGIQLRSDDYVGVRFSEEGPSLRFALSLKQTLRVIFAVTVRQHSRPLSKQKFFLKIKRAALSNLLVAWNFP